MATKRKAAAKPARKPVPKRKAGKRVGNNPADRAQRRRKFIAAMIENGGNRTQAAITAGFSPRSASSQGHRMIKNAEVAAALEAHRKMLASKYDLRVEDVIKSVSVALHFDPRKLYHEDGTLKAIIELDDDTAQALASFEVVEGKTVSEDGESEGEPRRTAIFTKKVKWLDKNTVREQAMRHLGLFKEDNKQKGDAIAALLEAIHERNTDAAGHGLPIKP
jgi:phage terminase small subunit